MARSEGGVPVHMCHDGIGVSTPYGEIEWHDQEPATLIGCVIAPERLTVEGVYGIARVQTAFGTGE